MWRLITPLDYFRIVNRSKTLIDIIPTCAFAAIVTFLFWISPGASFFRVEGFLDRLLTLTSALTAFYVAALLAAATFPSDDLNKVIRFGNVQIRKRDPNGFTNLIDLTRRQLICTIFGYLSYLCLFASISMSLVIALSKTSLKELRAGEIGAVLFGADIFPYERLIAMGFFNLMISHLFVVTSLGLYYIMDRLYQEDMKITSVKSGDDKAA